ncbi:hypothetical protein B7435_30405 [Mycolicibacterium peregrinum]|nr:hypothetical protein B7435_30405 [Mycolicibacterium peregrinum]
MSWWVWLIVAVVVITVVSWPVAAHNRLVSMQITVVEAWRGIDVELERRWELIPSLVEVARSYARHEADVLARVAGERKPSRVDANTSNALQQLHDRVIAEQSASESELSVALNQLLTVAEAYPQLRSAEHYRRLMEALSEAGDRVAAARRLYNGNVTRFNAALRSFPTSAVARFTGIDAADFLDVAQPDHSGVPPVRAGE